MPESPPLADDSRRPTLERFLDAGALPTDSPATRLGKRNVVIANLVVVAQMMILTTVFESAGIHGPALVGAGTVIAQVLNYWMLRSSRRFRLYLQVTTALPLVALIAGRFLLRGYPDANLLFVGLMVVPFSAAMSGRLGPTSLFLGIFIAEVVVANVADIISPPVPRQFPSWLAATYAPLLMAVFGIQLTLLILPLARGRRRQSEALKREHERSEMLLLNVLPPSVAAQLKDGPRAIAERFEATVLFGDIAGFTPLSAELTPHQIVAALDEVFSAFDDIAHRYGLEKIKTIGDAYMVVGGVPDPRPDHARAVACMALEMRAAIARMRFAGGRQLTMRIGIHTGEVVAGVIGKRKFCYDLWGDTVNTASRMESHGAPGEIQLSEAARDALGEAFMLEERGEVDVKGKGPMRTWWLRGARDAERSDGEMAQPSVSRTARGLLRS